MYATKSPLKKENWENRVSKKKFPKSIQATMERLQGQMVWLKYLKFDVCIDNVIILNQELKKRSINNRKVMPPIRADRIING